jgi:two-component system NtrC family sensor kinase
MRFSHSLPTRIFFGLSLLALAFGFVMGFSVYRMQLVRRHLELINTRYLRLTLLMGELQTIQGNLLNTVAQRVDGDRVSTFMRRQVTLASQYRKHYLRRARKLLAVARSVELGESDRQLARRIRQRLDGLSRSFGRNTPRVEQLFRRELKDRKQLRAEGERLLEEERRALRTIRKLSKELRTRVKAAAVDVEQAQRFSVWAGSGLIVLALLLVVLVTFRVYRLLQPLKKLVASTLRIGSGDYSERVQVEAQDELGQLAREFNKMAQAVEERERALVRSERLAAAGRIASHLTHEVRNPLNAIALNTELLEEELTALPQESRQEAESICRAVQREVDRLTEITEEYLQFARMPKPQLEHEDVNQLLSALLSFMDKELAEASIEVERQLASALPPVLGDENQLRQVFLNLLRNAGEAMAGGGALTITTEQRGQRVVVCIRDSGVGIASDDLTQIFDPFFSTKQGGTGLGLALTQQIVNEHGGTVEVESRQGEGTTFKVSLPLAEGLG